MDDSHIDNKKTLLVEKYSKKTSHLSSWRLLPFVWNLENGILMCEESEGLSCFIVEKEKWLKMESERVMIVGELWKVYMTNVHGLMSVKGCCAIYK